VVAASTPDEEERRWAIDNLEGVTIYSDYDEMIAKEDLQAVVVASVTAVHAEQTLKAIKKGYHVLCEKPLSIEVKIVSISDLLPTFEICVRSTDQYIL
jgi:myo-inositol 2-dehydrogenase/D-chiro-inositol 1-dehydrogenase